MNCGYFYAPYVSLENDMHQEIETNEVKTLNPMMRRKAVRWIREMMDKQEVREGEFISLTEALQGKEIEKTPRVTLTEAIRNKMKADPENWSVGHHFRWGMWMRNQLRMNGFSEKNLGIDNLDDYYVSMVEEAVKISD